MEETKDLARIEGGGLQLGTGLAALTARDIVSQVNLIQEVMAAAMKEGEHYGVIPGCGTKPVLLKPGAEKLNLLFRMNPDFEIDVIELPRDHREYRVKCRLLNNAGIFIGSGVGSCTTMEGKYRFRVTSEVTDTPVPKEYWDMRKTKPKEATAMLGGSGFGVKKTDSGQWVITKRGERVEHDNPADYYNTCLKIAKKRAFVDAILTRTAASDFFTQDIEDMVENIHPKKADQDIQDVPYTDVPDLAPDDDETGDMPKGDSYCLGHGDCPQCKAKGKLRIREGQWGAAYKCDACGKWLKKAEWSDAGLGDTKQIHADWEAKRNV